MVNLEILTRADRYRRRTTEIFLILGRYQLADWLQAIPLDWLQGLMRSEGGETLGDLSDAQRIRLALTELGPAFVKLGQILSTRPDLVSPELATELEKLQADTPPDSPETVRETVEAELGAAPALIFASFGEEAAASASIGQVHEARLEDGTAVVVKVQHAGIEDVIRMDLEILQALADLAERYAPALRVYRPSTTIREFSRTLLRELDFERERRHLEEFQRNFREDAEIQIPQVYPEHSSRRVLTLEQLQGTSLADLDDVDVPDFDGEVFIRRGARAYLDMIFRDSFYHADPHPGNLLVLPGNVVGLLDFGMVGRLDGETLTQVEDLLFTALDGDAEELTEIVRRIGDIPPKLDHDRLKAEVAAFLEDYVGPSLKEFDLGGALTRLMEVLRRFQILVPPAFSMLLKTLIMLEGTSQRISADFRLAELIQPYYRHAIERRYSPRALLHRFRRSFREWERFLDLIPRQGSEMLERARSGSFSIYLEHRRLDTTVNRLVLGILTAALFLGSTQLWAAKVPPVLAGVPVIGAAGCLIAMFLGYRLVRAIRKSGDLRWKG